MIEARKDLACQACTPEMSGVLRRDAWPTCPGAILTWPLDCVWAPLSGICVWPQIRESIKALFPNRTCFPLVRPMSDESQLQRLEAVPPSQLRPEFQQVCA